MGFEPTEEASLRSVLGAEQEGILHIGHWILIIKVIFRLDG